MGLFELCDLALVQFKVSSFLCAKCRVAGLFKVDRMESWIYFFSPPAISSLLTFIVLQPLASTPWLICSLYPGSPPPLSSPLLQSSLQRRQRHLFGESDEVCNVRKVRPPDWLIRRLLRSSWRGRSG